MNIVKKMQINKKSRRKIKSIYDDLGMKMENGKIYVPDYCNKIDLRRKSKSEKIHEKMLVLLEAINNQIHIDSFLLDIRPVAYKSLINQLVNAGLIELSDQELEFRSEWYIITWEYLKYQKENRNAKLKMLKDLIFGSLFAFLDSKL